MIGRKYGRLTVIRENLLKNMKIKKEDVFNGIVIVIAVQKMF